MKAITMVAAFCGSRCKSKCGAGTDLTRVSALRGVATSSAAEPLKSEIATSNDLPPVWPWPDGETRGVSLDPLYKSVPHAALRDPALYQFLALIDAIRDGRARERNLAERDLVHRFKVGSWPIPISNF